MKIDFKKIFSVKTAVYVGVGVAVLEGVTYLADKYLTNDKKRLADTLNKVNQLASSNVKALESQKDKQEQPTSLTFIDIKDTSEYVEVEMSEKEKERWSNTWSILLDNTLREALWAKGTSGLLKCDVPIDTLVKNSKNPELMRGWTVKDGKISQQANFSKADFTAAKVTQLTMMCLSIVTSQYYMHQLSQNLTGLNNEIKKISDFLESQEHAKVQTAFENILRRSGKHSYSDGDFAFVQDKLSDIEEVRNHYRINLQNAKLDAQHNVIIENEVKYYLRSFEQSEYFKNLEVALTIEEMYFRAILWVIDIALFLGKEEDVKILAQTLEGGFWKYYSNKFVEMRTRVLEFLRLERDKAQLNPGQIQHAFDDYTAKFSKMEKKLKSADERILTNVSEYIGYNDKGELSRFKKRETTCV